MVWCLNATKNIYLKKTFSICMNTRQHLEQIHWRKIVFLFVTGLREVYTKNVCFEKSRNVKCNNKFCVNFHGNGSKITKIYQERKIYTTFLQLCSFLLRRTRSLTRPSSFKKTNKRENLQRKNFHELASLIKSQCLNISMTSQSNHSYEIISHDTNRKHFFFPYSNKTERCL